MNPDLLGNCCGELFNYVVEVVVTLRSKIEVLNYSYS